MSIRLSKEYGVNPTILKCPCCGKETGLALLGRLKGDKKAPPYMYDRELCDECKKTHILVLEVENEENPKPTGACIAVPKDAINLECTKGIALMTKTDFQEMFDN